MKSKASAGHGDRREKWDRWLETIRAEVYRLHVNHHTFHRIRQFALDNPAFMTQGALATNAFWPFLHETFVHYAAVAVRRQCEVDTQVISLARLLDEIAENADLYQRDAFVAARTVRGGSKIEEETAQRANAFFDVFALGSGPEVDPLTVLMDLAHLHDSSQEIRRFADRRVAHFDKRETSLISDLSLVDEPIERISETLVRYHWLVRQDELDLCIPTVVDAHLEYLLRDPWKTFQPPA